MENLCVRDQESCFLPPKNKLNVKSSDAVQALFINAACERNGEKKNPAFAK